MHIPDGFLNAGTSIGGIVVAAGGLGLSVRRTAQILEEKQAPLAGLVAAFVFAVQMLNFPVAAGTSGHLLGGLLAAVLVGPWAGAICVAVVLIVQALLFADGGLTALGINIVNMALIGTFGGYGSFILLRRVLPRTRTGVLVASGVAAMLSVVLASIGFAIEYAIGGTGGAPVGTVATAMIGVHLLIGVGEGIITSMTVGAVLAARPDLVYGASNLKTPAALHGSATAPTRSTQ
jgi:cobalt/nickel transport system permease protein